MRNMKIKTIAISLLVYSGLIVLALLVNHQAKANAFAGPCPVGQSQCMIIPGYNAPTWTDPRWNDRRDGMPGQWGPNSGYTPITTNPYHPNWR